MLELPWTRVERVWPARQSANGAKIDDVSRELRIHGLRDVGADLHVVPTTGCTELFNTGNLIGEAHTSRALNAPVHGRLNKGAEILVLNSPLAGDLVEARPIRAIPHRLVLQITLATLITDGAI